MQSTSWHERGLATSKRKVPSSHCRMRSPRIDEDCFAQRTPSESGSACLLSMVPWSSSSEARGVKLVLKTICVSADR